MEGVRGGGGGGGGVDIKWNGPKWKASHPHTREWGASAGDLSDFTRGKYHRTRTISEAKTGICL